MKLISMIACLGIVLNACTQKYPIEDLPNNSNSLVVEGSFTNELKVHVVKLSRTLSYSEPTAQNVYPKETNAQVMITDDQGNTINFQEVLPGEYATTAPVSGIVGRWYVLNIITADGREYLSKPEQMKEVPPIEGISFKDKTEIGDSEAEKAIMVRFTDPVNTENYYQWYWKISLKDNISEWNPQWEWITDQDTYIDGNTVEYELETYERAEFEYVKVYQSCISKEAHNFLKLVKEQTGNNTGPFSTPPGPIYGNMYNTNDSKEVIFGFFMVANITTASARIED